ncbi:MAG: energy-coupling factor transporter transmembrane component T [Aeromicrobium sp.]|uniref:energy-coupling factor transporter transmembrane component T n=1 Tax=Aeromicrobium sp. TaxID=1871063 RepID=UPI002612299E|nr:energy-coupling factor transporter transmembrane component T [Aeromicrobium sp.]MDF1705645.1 energy-coupling factor transporter transmembrane component T [Aeromicrobium sp.]
MLARDLHPGAWWLWAIGLAAAATFTLNPVALLLIWAIAALVVMARRSEAPWALSFRLYVFLAIFIVVLRVVFRIVFGTAATDADVIVLHLPEIPLPEAARGIQLLGDVTLVALLSGFYDGLRLGAIVLCVGAANALANPKRLLKSVPPALYEVGTAVVVALTIFPQLAESVQRVNRARQLRGSPRRGVGVLRRVVVPVLEDALERSMTLAMGMDARGYGRSGRATARERLVTGVLMLIALFALCVGIYAYLDATAPRALAVGGLAVGLLTAAAGLWSAGRRVERTRYRPDRWRTAELVTAGAGIAVAIGVDRAYALDPFAVVPGLDGWPEVSPWVLAIIMVGALPAFVTPPPAVERGTQSPSPEEVVDA